MGLPGVTRDLHRGGAVHRDPVAPLQAAIHLAGLAPCPAGHAGLLGLEEGEGGRLTGASSAHTVDGGAQVSRRHRFRKEELSWPSQTKRRPRPSRRKKPKKQNRLRNGITV